MILKEEIFGPVLPVVVVKDLDDAISRARKVCSQPLALYMYSENSRNVEKVLRSVTSEVHVSIRALSKSETPIFRLVVLVRVE